MIYSDFNGEKLSLLGFGTMRLPVDDFGKIDKAQVEKMVELAFKNGVNYFDTAFPYHNGLSEIVIGEVLSKYPRDSFKLATKYPGHQLASSYNPKKTFEMQLKKCNVEYFDFYLLHNVCESSFNVYDDESLNIIDYFVKEKQNGRIKHLGFSSHGDLPLLKKFLDKYSSYMEFAQIQFNYLDYTLQKAKEKYDLISSYGILIWVMKPVRGGKLSRLPKDAEEKLKSIRPNDSISSWGFRFLQSFGNIKMILSGMSNIGQMVDNLKTFSEADPLSKDEESLLLNIADSLKSGVPCTSCKYCMEGCPMGLNIPKFMSLYNEFRVDKQLNSAMYIEFLDDNKKPSACIKCGKCERICPQKINIRDTLVSLTEIQNSMPKWREISKVREEEAKRLESN